METTPKNPANDPEDNNTDGLDQMPANDNSELEKINTAVQAAEPSFTLNDNLDSLAEKEKENPGKS